VQSQNKIAKREAEAAEKAAQADYNALTEQQRQINQQATLEKMERIRQSLRERARLVVALGEAGADGLSPLRELSNVSLQTSYDIGIMDENQQNRRSQNILEQEAVRTNAQSRINVAKSKYIKPLHGALIVGSSAIQGYGAGFQYGKTLSGGG
jgi:predicted metal-dependent phosphoesterase TrpH